MMTIVAVAPIVIVVPAVFVPRVGVSAALMLKNAACDVQMFAQCGQLGARQIGDLSVALIGFITELIDVLIVVIDHVTRELHVKFVPTHARKAIALVQCHRRYVAIGYVNPMVSSDILRLHARLAVIVNERLPESADFTAASLLDGNVAEHDFRIVPLHRVVQEPFWRVGKCRCGARN
jgi:hypothetical protein